MGPGSTLYSRDHVFRPSSAVRRPGLRLGCPDRSMGRGLSLPRTLSPAGRGLSRASKSSRGRLSVRRVGAKATQGSRHDLPDRRERLDALGFVWDPFAVQWEEGFRFLERYRREKGHCRVPNSHCEDCFQLGTWVSVQRQNKDRMLPERLQRLEALGFVWDPHVASWKKACASWKSFTSGKGIVVCQITISRTAFG